MKPKKLEIVALGNIFYEHIQFPSRTDGPFLGGTVSYAAMALGRLGSRAGLVSSVGGDMPLALYAPLLACGVDREGFHVRPEQDTTTNLLIYHESGDKTIRYIKRAPDILVPDIPKRYETAGLAFFCPVDFEIPIETVHHLRELGMATAADLGGFGGAHVSAERREWFAADRRRIFEEYASRLDIAKASLEDCRHIFGREEITLAECVHSLLDAGIGTILMTLGAQGTLIATQSGERIDIPALPAKVVDTTGAGDTYIAAFLTEYVRTRDLKWSGGFATAASAILIEKTGGVSTERTPSRDMVLARLRGIGTGG